MTEEPLESNGQKEGATDQTEKHSPDKITMTDSESHDKAEVASGGTINQDNSIKVVTVIVVVFLVCFAIIYVIFKQSSNVPSTPNAGKIEQWANEDRILNLNGHELRLKPIRSGRFQMGSLESDAKPYKYFKHEAQHWVNLTQDFWLGETEVTQAQWKAIMGTTLREQVTKTLPDEVHKYVLRQGDGYPMQFVSWSDAMDFCRKLTAREREAGRLSDKWEFTLPTEAQWEYAARGGEKSNGYKYSGSNNLEEVGWYYENSGERPLDENKWNLEDLVANKCGVHPVGGKKPNELGLLDMSGNVQEWCRDSCEHDKEYNIISDTYREDEEEDPWCRKGSERIFRGGGWISDAHFCRLAYRDGDALSDCSDFLGFRIALVPVQ